MSRDPYSFWISFESGITVPSFIILRYVQQILSRGASPPNHPWAAPKKPILNRVTYKHLARILSKHFTEPCFLMNDWVLRPYVITQRALARWPLQLGAQGKAPGIFGNFSHSRFSNSHASFGNLMFSFLGLFSFCTERLHRWWLLKVKTKKIRLSPSHLNSFSYFFLFWFKRLSAKSQFKI